MNKSFSLKEAIILTGSLIAYYIGAGFATGQEVMQYCASYGRQGACVIIGFMILFSYAIWSFARAGADGGLIHGKDVFYYFCGKKLGALYDVYTVVFLYFSLILMHGGAASTAQTQYGTAPWIGALILALLVAGTVLLGLDRLVDILGCLGPIIILMILFVTAYTIFHDAGNIPEGLRLIESGEVAVPRVGRNFFTAMLSNVGFPTLFYAPFMAELGARKGRSEMRFASFGGTFAICAAMGIVTLALIADIKDVAVSDIPTLIMAQKVSPLFAQAYSVIVFIGIYTTSVPLLWTVSTRFFESGTASHRIAVVLLSVLAVIVPIYLPYRTLVNMVYGIGGYIGVSLLLFLLAHDLRAKFA